LLTEAGTVWSVSLSDDEPGAGRGLRSQMGDSPTRAHRPKAQRQLQPDAPGESTRAQILSVTAGRRTCIRAPEGWPHGRAALH
jgi:hypothetical protein